MNRWEQLEGAKAHGEIFGNRGITSKGEDN